MKIPFYKKAISYFFPFKLKEVNSVKNNLLRVYLFRNQMMLSCADAIYSQGTSYEPFRLPFKKIKKEISSLNSFLLLGTGLGSALQILQEDYHHYPESTLVDIDEEVLALSKEWMNLNVKNNVEWICEDALLFLKESTNKYDLIGVDVFKGTRVPYDIQTEYFINLCAERLSPNGIVIFNFISQNKTDALLLERNMKHKFKNIDTIQHFLNTFYICKNH
jgi:16S rRNA G1207 methylase RsmC